jgi:hypothetical protein
LPKKLLTFWYYLWRQRISERQKCFLTIFDFRRSFWRSDFQRSDQADDYCHFRHSDQLLFLSLSTFWSTLKILLTFWSINQLLDFRCSFFDFRQSDFRRSDPFPIGSAWVNCICISDAVSSFVQFWNLLACLQNTVCVHASDNIINTNDLLNTFSVVNTLMSSKTDISKNSFPLKNLHKSGRHFQFQGINEREFAS